ncbi:hypothetical protein MIR68_009016 [Amoeboaphelidium protococcarum]|nr:hypothetical protein MIR68_009016 [Amoeboaphelidium protococcarum]
MMDNTTTTTQSALYKIIFQILHGNYAVVHVILLVQMCILFRKFSPVALAVYGILIIVCGLIFDNVLRCASPSILNDVDYITYNGDGVDDDVEQSIAVQMLKYGVCMTYLLHGTTISILFAAAYHIIDRLFPPSHVLIQQNSAIDKSHHYTATNVRPQWLKIKELLYGVALLAAFCGAYDFFVETRPCQSLHIVEKYGIKLFVSTKAQKAGLMSPALIAIILSCILYLVLAVIVAVKTGQKLALYLSVSVFALYAFLTPPKADDPETLFNFLRMALSNGVEILYMLSIYVIVKVVYGDQDYGNYNKIEQVIYLN